MQVFQLLNSSKLFDLLSKPTASLRWQIPQFMSLCVVSPPPPSHVCGSVARRTCALSPTNEFEGAFVSSVESEAGLFSHTSECQQHMYYHSLKQYPSALYIVLLSTLRGAVNMKPFMVILHYMIEIWISCSHNVLCSMKRFYFWLKRSSRAKRCSDDPVWPCVSVLENVMYCCFEGWRWTGL